MLSKKWRPGGHKSSPTCKASTGEYIITRRFPPPFLLARFYCGDSLLRIYFTEMDSVSPEKRSWVMAQVKGRDTRPEKVVRSLMHRMGYRFRIQRADLPGKPDIQSFSSMAVFGTGIQTVNSLLCPRQTSRIGSEKLRAMWRETRNAKRPWKILAGMF